MPTDTVDTTDAVAAKAWLDRDRIHVSEAEFNRLHRCNSFRLLRSDGSRLKALFEYGGDLFAIVSSDEEVLGADHPRIAEAVRVVFAETYQGETRAWSPGLMRSGDVEGAQMEHDGVPYVVTGGVIRFTTAPEEDPTPTPKPKEIGTGEANRPKGQGLTWYQWCSSFGLPGGSAAWEKEREEAGPAWQAYFEGKKPSQYTKELAAKDKTHSLTCVDCGAVCGVGVDDHQWTDILAVKLSASSEDRVIAKRSNIGAILTTAGRFHCSTCGPNIGYIGDTPINPANPANPLPKTDNVDNADNNDELQEKWYAWCRQDHRHPSGPNSYFDKMRRENGALWQSFLQSLEAPTATEPQTEPVPVPQGIKKEHVQTHIQTQIPPIDTSFVALPLSQICRSLFNPRETFDKEYLEGLGTSIKENGLIQPITVRPVPASAFKIGEERTYRGGQMVPGFSITRQTQHVAWYETRKEAEENLPRFEIVAGEQRWRASEMAGLPTIQALIRQLDDETALSNAVLENLQRKGLDPLEEANGFQKLVDLGWTHEKIADKLGCSKSKITKTVGLSRLPKRVQELLRAPDTNLTVSHGQRLLSFAEFPDVCTALAEKANEARWTVRKLEAPLPYETVNFLKEKKLVKQFDHYETAFDWKSICLENCPFNAFRKDDYGYGVCLKPAHYIELQRGAKKAEAEKQKAAAIDATVAYQKTRQAQTAEGVSQLPTVSPEPEAVPETKPTASVPSVASVPSGVPLAIKVLPKLRVLKNVDVFASNDCRGYIFETGRSAVDRPSGCGADCPCAGAALRDNNTVAEICTNPKRRTELQEAQSLAITEERTRQADQRGRTALAAMQAEKEEGLPVWNTPPVLSTIVLHLLEKAISSKAKGKTLRPILSRCGISLPDDAFTDSDFYMTSVGWETLSTEASLPQLFMIAAELEVLNDTEERIRGWRQGPDLTGALLLAGKPKKSPMVLTAALESEAQDE